MPPSKDDPRPSLIAEPTGSDYYTRTVHNDTYPAISPLSANLSGRSVLIAGASRGIGKAIALSYARAGATQIAIGARSDLSAVADELEAAAKEAKRATPKVLLLSLDVTSKESVRQAAEAVKKDFGRLDILINNAGIFGKGAPVADADVDAWWNTYTVNLLGPFLTSHAFLPLLLSSSPHPHIINVASVGAHLVVPGLSAYQPSKLALVRFTEFLQVEYGNKGLTAMSIHPGNVKTDILASIGGVPKGLEHVVVETPELAADTVTFLTTGDGRRWLGGRYVNVTWDMGELMEREGEIVEGDKLKVKLVW